MEDSSQIVPLQMESPVGQFLSQILVSHPHLLPAAVDQQLQTDRIAEQSKEDPAPSIPCLRPESSAWPASAFRRLQPWRVWEWDPDTLQRYATIRSKEAFGIIEKQTEALFGRSEIVIAPEGTADASMDELIEISFAGLRRLLLEAVIFGSFLWGR